MTPAQQLKHEIKSSGLSKRQWYRTIYLHSEHWDKLREQKTARDGKRCKCGRKEFLHCHHIRYRSIFNVTLDDLQWMCKKCHKAEHRKLKQDRRERRELRKQEKLLSEAQELDRQLDQHIQNEP